MANVGDLKGNELPLQFFLDYAWDPIPLSGVDEWRRGYAAQSFPARPAGEVAGILDEYGNLQALRKPELLNRRISGQGSSITYDDQATKHGDTKRVELLRDFVLSWPAIASS